MEINSELSLILQQNLATSMQDMQVSMAKIASGNQQSAVEDAAQLIISEGMESERRGSEQAIENAQIGMNMLQTAESDLSSINDNLQRVRELTVQRNNGTYGEAEIAAIDDEITALTDEINRVSSSSSFNDINLLDGSNTDVSLQIGANSGDSLDVGDALTDTSTGALGLTGGSLTLDDIDNALQNVTSKRASIGATSNRLESTVNSLYTQTENLAAAESRMIDTDIAAETAKLAQSGILANASGSLLAQANQTPAIAATLL